MDVGKVMVDMRDQRKGMVQTKVSQTLRLNIWPECGII